MEIRKNFQCGGTELFYQNKKEARQWFQALSAQMPLLGGNKSGFIRSISQEESKVKFSMRNSSGAVTLNVKKSTDVDTYTYDNIAIMLDGKEVGTIGMVADENEPFLERIGIAQLAKEQSYRGVKITNIYDNGGRGANADTGNVYIYFYPQEDVKSADSVTYDDKGNVIPLSERFNTENEDIRYSMRKKLASFDIKEYNEVKLGKQEYARLSAAIGTYQPNARGFVTQILDNEKGEPAYCYDAIVSDDRIVVVRKYGGTNIHEKRRYAAAYRERKGTDRGTGGRRYAGQNDNIDDIGSGGRAISGNDGIYQRRTGSGEENNGRKSGENTPDFGERSGQNLTVSDLDKSQYQLRREDINRLNILEGLKPMRKSTGFFAA